MAVADERAPLPGRGPALHSPPGRREAALRETPPSFYPIADADFACSRRTNFWILPVEVLGSTQNSTCLGTL